MRVFTLVAFATLVGLSPLFAQYAVIGQSPFTGSGNTERALEPSPDGSGVMQLTFTTTNAASNRNFQFVTTVGGVRQIVGPAACSGNQDISSLVGQTITGSIGCGTSNFRAGGFNNTVYIFRTVKGTESGTFVFFRLTSPVRAITSVSDNTSAGIATDNRPVTVQARLGGIADVPNGQNLLVAYSTDGYSTTQIQAMTADATGQYSANLPAQPEGTVVNYYLVSSAVTSVFPLSELSLRTIATERGADNLGYSYLVTAALPATLLNWTAERKLADVHLRWSTAGEYALDHYAVERSQDGGLRWTELFRQKPRDGDAVGNYHYVDRNAPGDGLLYRLRTVDLDGGESYSITLAVRAETSGDVSVYPHPAPASVMRVRGPAGPARLVDGLGRTVVEFELTGQEQSLPANNLAAGVYWLVLADKLFPPRTLRIL